MSENFSMGGELPACNSQVNHAYNYFLSPLAPYPGTNFIYPPNPQLVSYSRSWTQEEDKKIFQATRKHGNNWAKIVTRFTDRTQNEIKGRWEYLESLAQERGITIKKPKTEHVFDNSHYTESLLPSNVGFSAAQNPSTFLLEHPYISNSSAMLASNQLGFLNDSTLAQNNFQTSAESQALHAEYSKIIDQLLQNQLVSHSAFMPSSTNQLYSNNQGIMDKAQFQPTIQESTSATEDSSQQDDDLGEETLMSLATKIYNNPLLIELLLKLSDMCINNGRAPEPIRRPSKRSRGDQPAYRCDGSLLLYQLANSDFPEELEGDCDFEEGDSEYDSDGNFKSTVSVGELNELMADTLNSPEIDKDDDGLFTQNILRQIRLQQKQNLQLVLQSYAMECSFRGPNSKMALHWRSQALQIKELNAFGMRYSSDAFNSSQDPFLSFLAVAGAEYIEEILDILANPPENILCLPNDVLSSRSQGLNLSIDKGRGLAYFFPDDKFAVSGSPRVLVEKARIIYIICKTVLEPIFVESLLPYFFFSNKRTRSIFVTAEDNLLTLGLHIFSDDWASIRSHILPVRLDHQLANRFNNTKSRKVNFHPIQLYYAEATRPLTADEACILREGIKKYGKNYRLIQQKLLPKRPTFFLKRALRDQDSRKNTTKTTK
ncbi:hypothetical protein DSO57_1034308 [Entomophthora muscae]|uniref:Uncharacterized protein n=1 Tax=Entomophthora muscae TaxID=34485 RepID=A0ACC2SCY6_9FUNG|nr:hypothetical protein DSO57_1034308 [Entomophthora muscae]